MNNIDTYKDLEVWIEGRKLVSQVYRLTRKFPREELFGLTDQMRRAAVSVLSNIAEACGRGTSRGSASLLFISRGSLYEVETQSIIASDLGYCSENELNVLIHQTTICKKLLNGFIRYYESKASSN